MAYLLDKELKMKIIDKVDNKIIKPSIVSTQLPLPFNQLDFRRFEYLVLAVAVQKYGLQDPEHIGCGGSDGGVDIQGFIKREEKTFPIAIQAKNYQKITGKTLIDALEKFYKKNFPKFKGEFWIVTSAGISDKAREQFAKEANKKKIGRKVIDGSTLEADLRSIPNLLEVFFSTSNSPKKESLYRTAMESLEILQLFKDEFLDELDTSFSGNDELITEREQVLYSIVTKAIRKLKAKMIFLSDDFDILDSIQKSAKILISNYNLRSLTAQGKLFWEEIGKEALSRKEEQIENFISKYEVLREGLKKYLDS